MMFRSGFTRAGAYLSCLRNPWGMAIMAAVAILVIALIVILIVKAAKKHKASASNESLDLLKAKFVQGELTEEEYLRKKKILSD